MRSGVLVLAVAAVACRSADDRAPEPRANRAAMKATAPLPTGWIAVEPPTDERRMCANHANTEWRVALDHGSVAIARATESEPDTGPALPFALPKQPEFHGRKHVLAAPAGFVVGLDAGEWGGALYAMSSDGAQRTKLADQNVRGLVQLGEEVVSLEGLSHLSIDEGNARWLRRDAVRWREIVNVPLDGAPAALTATAEAIYLVTGKSVVRIGRDRKPVSIQPIRMDYLYPDSLVVDETGQIWIGMRHFVVRLSPDGSRYTQTWLVPEHCRTAHLDEAANDCVCNG